MKKTGCILTAISLLIAGCLKTENTEPIGGDFWLKMGDNSIVAAADIDFYDISTHMIYLKSDAQYLKNGAGSIGSLMSVNVDDEEIYKCAFHSIYSSSLPNGPFICWNLPFFSDDIISINFMQILDSNGKPQFTDHRSDERIIAALKNNRLYHEGLRCEFQSVDYSNGKLSLDIELSNPDTFDYYYLDPDKMGIGLFHYFTNGPYFRDKSNSDAYTHKETVISPVPWDSWEKSWLSLIKSGERKKITINYNHFDNIPSGNYKMNFYFPGLNRLPQKDRKLGSGRIWMGSICIEKDITI
jgi:hypothetical protein